MAQEFTFSFLLLFLFFLLRAQHLTNHTRLLRLSGQSRYPLVALVSLASLSLSDETLVSGKEHESLAFQPLMSPKDGEQGETY